MASKFDRIPTSAIFAAPTFELREAEMNKILGGDARQTPKGEASKEAVTFEYGALVIRYGA
jgi:hypothetical protein